MRTRNRPATLALGLLLLAGGLACRPSAADEVPAAGEAAPLHDAMANLTDVIVYDIFSPPQASRAYAYASIAAYEVLRQGDARFRTMAGQVNGLAPVPAAPEGPALSLPLAGVHAFMTVGRQLTFSRDRMDSLRTAMHERFARQGMDAATMRRSIAYGDTVAAHVLAWAATDGFTTSRGMPKFAVTEEPGRWIPTPPAYMDAVEPNWGTLRPFAMDSASQFRPAPPHPFDTARTSPFMREALEVYDAGRAITDEQREWVAFWDCNPYVMHVQGHSMFATKKITPGGHWIGIAGIVARKANAGLAATAETYARTAIALADGFISSWEEKYRSGVVRPETVINAYVDEAWQPVLQTPPFPEYTSGHSVISTAAAQVLADMYGRTFAYVDSSEVPYGLAPRPYASFDEAAAEAAMSRLYGGIHYRRAIEEGVVQGRRVGQHVAARVRTRDSAPPATVAAR